MVGLDILAIAAGGTCHTTLLRCESDATPVCCGVVDLKGEIKNVDEKNIKTVIS